MTHDKVNRWCVWRLITRCSNDSRYLLLLFSRAYSFICHVDHVELLNALQYISIWHTTESTYLFHISILIPLFETNHYFLYKNTIKQILQQSYFHTLFHLILFSVHVFQCSFIRHTTGKTKQTNKIQKKKTHNVFILFPGCVINAYLFFRYNNV